MQNDLPDVYWRHRGSPALDDSFLPGARRVNDEWNKSEQRQLATRRPTKTFELHQLDVKSRVIGNEHLYCFTVIYYGCIDVWCKQWSYHDDSADGISAVEQALTRAAAAAD